MCLPTASGEIQRRLHRRDLSSVFMTFGVPDTPWHTQLLSAVSFETPALDRRRTQGHHERHRLCVGHGGPLGSEHSRQSRASHGGDRLIVFRHDLMKHSYRPAGDSLVLQTWLMSDLFAPDFLDERIVSLPAEIQGERLHVISLMTRLPKTVSARSPSSTCTLVVRTR